MTRPWGPSSPATPAAGCQPVSCPDEADEADGGVVCQERPALKVAPSLVIGLTFKNIHAPLITGYYLLRRLTYLTQQVFPAKPLPQYISCPTDQ